MYAWALEVLGLTRLEQFQGTVADLKRQAKKKGRALLGKYHPDRPSGDIERFKAINTVLQKLDEIVESKPQIRVSVTFYPPQYPQGPSTTVRTSYFDNQVHSVKSTGIQYDSRKVVPMKPR